MDTTFGHGKNIGYGMNVFGDTLYLVLGDAHMSPINGVDRLKNPGSPIYTGRGRRPLGRG